MTASEVGGHAVIAVEPAKSNWKGRDGEPLEYRQMLRLLLDDGTELFGCLHCNYTHPSLHSVRPHLNKHRLSKHDEAATIGGLSLAEIARALNSHERQSTELEEWKRRALKAEGQLRTLRKALGVNA